MSKRNAKKRIGTMVAAGIDKLMALPINEEQLEGRLQSLLMTYEDAITRINQAAKLSKGTSMNKYFNALFEEVDGHIAQHIKE